MSIKEILEELGIEATGSYLEDGSYLINIDNTTEWGKMYSKLENNEDLEQQDELSLLTVDTGNQVFEKPGEYQVVLNADFNGGVYKLIIDEMGV